MRKVSPKRKETQEVFDRLKQNAVPKNLVYGTDNLFANTFFAI